MAVASSMPATISFVQAGEGGSGYSSLAQRELSRRQDAITEGDALLVEGRAAYAKGDYQQAVDKYRQALDRVPNTPMFEDRHKSYVEHLSDASVALAIQHRKTGKYAEARTLLEAVLAENPESIEAKREMDYLDDPIRTNPALTYEHTQNVDKVRRGLYTAEGNYNLGKYDAAKSEYNNVLRLDPYNSAARRGLERVSVAKSDYYRAAYDHTRAELLSQVDQAWEISVPSNEFDVGVTPGEMPDADSGVAIITRKLKNIIIPRVDFEDTTVEEAIEFLRQRATELDTAELDPTKKGVNINVRRARANTVAATVGGLGEGGGEAAPAVATPAQDPNTLRINNLRSRNLPLEVVLQYICEQTKLKVKVDNYSVTLVPITEESTDTFSRTFRVSPDFQSKLDTGAAAAGAGAAADPFGSDAAKPSLLNNRKPIKDLLIANGVIFSAPGSSATLSSSGSLLANNTPIELEKIEALIEAVGNDKPKQVKITTKFIEISQENNDELGFDWLVSPFNLTNNIFGNNNQTIFGSGGTKGNQGGRAGSDFIGNVAGTTITGVPQGAGQFSDTVITNGLRSGDQAVNRNNIDAILNNPNRNSQTASVAPGIAALTGFFSNSQVQLIMRGLAQKKGTDLMTAPSVTAKSGQKATIEIIREFIYPTEYEPPELPQQTGGNFGGGILGGIGGGGGGGGGFPVTPATPTAFETRNTGVTLEIQPTIGSNDFVIDLDFVPEIVEFEGFINYGSPIQAPSTDALGNPVVSVITENRIEMPVFSSRRVKTSLTIYDGYTVAVGGLMREDVQNVEDKVPILGDIPVIGRLFQSKGENRIKSNLIIFVTAQIIDATGRPLRGPDAAPTSSVVGGSTDGGVLPPL
jgi:general secretion pathway protein D